MPAYFIVDNEVTDPAGFEEYRKQVPATVEKYGGRFLVRGGQIHTLEGDWKPKRIVVTEFPSVEQARRWYDSEEYRALKVLRARSASGSVLLVEGVLLSPSRASTTNQSRGGGEAPHGGEGDVSRDGLGTLRRGRPRATRMRRVSSTSSCPAEHV